MKTIKNRKAEGYIDVAVAVLVISFLIVFLLSVFGLVSKKQDLNYMAAELVDTASSFGRVGTEVQDRYAKLCEETGLHPAMNFEAVYFDPSTGAVQLGKVISVTLELDSSLLGFGGVIFPFSLTASASGLSRVYWK